MMEQITQQQIPMGGMNNTTLRHQQRFLMKSDADKPATWKKSRKSRIWSLCPLRRHLT